MSLASLAECRNIFGQIFDVLNSALVAASKKYIGIFPADIFSRDIGIGKDFSYRALLAAFGLMRALKRCHMAYRAIADRDHWLLYDGRRSSFRACVSAAYSFYDMRNLIASYRILIYSTYAILPVCGIGGVIMVLPIEFRLLSAFLFLYSILLGIYVFFHAKEADHHSMPLGHYLLRGWRAQPPRFIIIKESLMK